MIGCPSASVRDWSFTRSKPGARVNMMVLLSPWRTSQAKVPPRPEAISLTKGKFRKPLPAEGDCAEDGAACSGDRASAAPAAADRKRRREFTESSSPGSDGQDTAYPDWDKWYRLGCCELRGHDSPARGRSRRAPRSGASDERASVGGNWSLLRRHRIARSCFCNVMFQRVRLLQLFHRAISDRKGTAGAPRVCRRPSPPFHDQGRTT